MKKRVFAALLAVTLTLSLAPAAFAEGFADVSDELTARNVEVLRLMGVVEGDDNAAFRPNSNLTRAEFCKMAVVLTGKRSVVTRYSTRTVFPDVRGSHWAAGYVNYAASTDAGLIHGMPDGSFQPDRNITYGEAVTILMRQLGYKDADTGGIWPDGYIALAGEAGMTKGLAVTGGAAITRAQAARLFVNALTSKNDEGTTLLAKLGYTVDLTKETTLYSVDAVNGKLRTKDKDYAMANPMVSTTLNGLKGYVVTNAAGEAATFLPAASTAGSAASDAAVIVLANGSTAGFDALTGGAANYTIYRNGVRSTASALKMNDVVTYNASTNTLQVCDTRVVAWYEGCTPSPSAPTSITALGGTEFSVLPTAQQSLARFKPGQVMVLLLTADGQVAGAVANGTAGASGNAFGYVDGDGKLSLICGGALRALNGKYSAYANQAVRVSQSSKTAVTLSSQVSSANGALDLTAKTVGTRKLADGALVFSGGVLTSVEALGVSRVEQSRIAYARTNAAGEVDLIVLTESVSELYGRVVLSTSQGKWVWNADKGENDAKIEGTTGTTKADDGETYWEWKAGYGPYAPRTSENGHYEQITTITLQRPGQKDLAKSSGYSVRTGDFVSTRLNRDESGFYDMRVLARLANVPASAWIGDAAVNFGGQTYTVEPENVICYNRDAGSWFASLSEAKAYGGTMDLFVKDGVVRAVEVRA